MADDDIPSTGLAGIGNSIYDLQRTERLVFSPTGAGGLKAARHARGISFAAQNFSDWGLKVQVDRQFQRPELQKQISDSLTRQNGGVLIVVSYMMAERPDGNAYSDVNVFLGAAGPDPLTAITAYQNTPSVRPVKKAHVLTDNYFWIARDGGVKSLLVSPRTPKKCLAPEGQFWKSFVK